MTLSHLDGTAACDRLSGRGLLGKAKDSLSLRHPGEPTYDLWSFAEENAPLTQSPRQAFVATEGGLHGAIYRERGDVGAIVMAATPWAGRLSESPAGMPAIFDEQVRHIGTNVPRVTSEAELLSSLATGNNAFHLGKQIVCLGTTLERVVFNLELLEKCAKSFLLASATGGAVRQIPWIIQRIAFGRLRKDERRAAESFARGEFPAAAKGY